MMIFSSITAVFTSIAEGFRSLIAVKERQSETNVLKTLKKRVKAVDYAEKIIFMADKVESLANDKHYQKYRKLFFKYN